MSEGVMIRARRLIRRIADRRKPRGLGPRHGLVLGAICAAAAGLSGCISDPFNHPTDPNAPGAAAISAEAAHPGAYPHWSQFPAAPVNVPTVAMWNTQAKAADADQTELLHQAADLKWTLYDTDAWSAEQRRLIDPTFAVPAPLTAEADAEAFAAKARALAAPPPPVK
jgi:hypothetical protein